MIKRQGKGGFRRKPGIMRGQNRHGWRFPAPKREKQATNEGFHAWIGQMAEWRQRGQGGGGMGEERRGKRGRKRRRQWRGARPRRGGGLPSRPAGREPPQAACHGAVAV